MIEAADECRMFRRVPRSRRWFRRSDVRARLKIETGSRMDVEYVLKAQHAESEDEETIGASSDDARDY